MKISASVYMIRNSKNNKVYVGSAMCAKTRWKEHVGTLLSKKHPNVDFVNDWKCSKEEDWQFIELESGIPSHLRYAVEQFYLDKYKSYDPTYGYNLCKKVSLFGGFRKEVLDKHEKVVSDIKDAIENGEKYRDIAKTFGVSLGLVAKVKAMLLPDFKRKNNNTYGFANADEILPKIIKRLSEKDRPDCWIAADFGTNELVIRKIKKKFLPELIVKKRIDENKKAEVISLVRDGKRYREIAKMTGLSLGSISKIARQ